MQLQKIILLKIPKGGMAWHGHGDSSTALVYHSNNLFWTCTYVI